MALGKILQDRLEALYSGSSGETITTAWAIIEPDAHAIAARFYERISQIPELHPVLENAVVKKNLPEALADWLRGVFLPHPTETAIKALIDRQREVGSVHADINVNLSYFSHALGILKREIYERIRERSADREAAMTTLLTVADLFDILLSFISESYFKNELIHENNELSLKVKGFTQNTAIECERLRSMLLDWLRNTLTFLYQTPDLDSDSLPKLRFSTFGLWVIYKSEYISHPLSISETLKGYIDEIDGALLGAARRRIEGDAAKTYEAVQVLNDAVSRCSWFISSVVDQALEIDTGMDPLTRLFNRRYLDTILRRQTEIAIRQGLPYSLLLIDIDHFKRVNDNEGHEAGDAVLKQFAEILLLNVRTSDFVFRFGGEEFLVILGNASTVEAWRIGEKIRHRCETRVFRLAGDQTVSVTCSAGIAKFGGHPDYNRLVKEADEALYRAKSTGRNRTVVAEP